MSILIPTRNRASLLRKSLRSALDQTHEFLEVIVLDNASGDSTPEVISSFAGDPRLRSFRHGWDLGMAANWRAGLEACRGDWFLLLPDDDYLTDRDYLARAVGILRRNPDVVLLYSSGDILDRRTGRVQRLKFPFSGIVDGREVFLSVGRVLPLDFMMCNTLFRREIALREEAFTRDHSIGIDYELFLRSCLHGKVAVCQEAVSVFLQHGDNLGSSYVQSFPMILSLFDWALRAAAAARSAGVLDPESLRAWLTRNLGPWVRIALTNVRDHHPRRMGEAIEAIRAIAPEALEHVLRDPWFSFKLRLSGFPSLFRLARRLSRQFR